MASGRTGLILWDTSKRLDSIGSDSTRRNSRDWHALVSYPRNIFRCAIQTLFRHRLFQGRHSVETSFIIDYTNSFGSYHILIAAC